MVNLEEPKRLERASWEYLFITEVSLAVALSRGPWYLSAKLRSYWQAILRAFIIPPPQQYLFGTSSVGTTSLVHPPEKQLILELFRTFPTDQI